LGHVARERSFLLGEGLGISFIKEFLALKRALFREARPVEYIEDVAD